MSSPIAKISVLLKKTFGAKMSSIKGEIELQEKLKVCEFSLGPWGTARSLNYHIAFHKAKARKNLNAHQMFDRTKKKCDVHMKEYLIIALRKQQNINVWISAHPICSLIKSSAVGSSWRTCNKLTTLNNYFLIKDK